MAKMVKNWFSFLQKSVFSLFWMFAMVQSKNDVLSKMMGQIIVISWYFGVKYCALLTKNFGNQKSSQAMQSPLSITLVQVITFSFKNKK